MKRSAVVEMIAKKLWEKHYDTESDDTFVDAKKEAHQILKTLEGLGMHLVRYKPSGCLHSMREMCNCTSEVNTEWDFE